MSDVTIGRALRFRLRRLAVSGGSYCSCASCVVDSRRSRVPSFLLNAEERLCPWASEGRASGSNRSSGVRARSQIPVTYAKNDGHRQPKASRDSARNLIELCDQRSVPVVSPRPATAYSIRA
jgi:hypothetical protein